MNRNAGIAVTLSSELLDRLRLEAKALGIPLEYVVASLVVDTMESAEANQASMNGSGSASAA